MAMVAVDKDNVEGVRNPQPLFSISIELKEKAAENLQTCPGAGNFLDFVCVPNTHHTCGTEVS